MKVKKTISIDDTVLSAVNAYADKYGISLSGAISVLCMQSLQALQAVDSMNDLRRLLDELQGIKDAGEQAK